MESLHTRRGGTSLQVSIGNPRDPCRLSHLLLGHPQGAAKPPEVHADRFVAHPLHGEDYNHLDRNCRQGKRRTYSISRFANFATSFRFPDFSKKTVRRASSPSPSNSSTTPGPSVGWRTRLPRRMARRGAA